MSTNEELPQPPKPRASPLDFRNTDLVSRLLAATPPYLYNMPMVPNSYFFSEMLRSFVQAKAEANRGALPLHHRRSRKRPWMQQRDFYQKEAKPEVPSPNWNQKSPTPEKRTEIPLELTIDKPKEEYQQQQQPKMPPPNVQPPPMMFPHPPQQETNQNLILPPPPPIWYPPLYPAPYGIDPLHFFIDLRVSGHIYDRKQKESTQPSSPTNTQSAPPTEAASTEKSESYDFKEGFKQSRHASAFKVPIPNSKNSPMNLSNRSEENKVKFDVKSMGFERPYNRASTNYVMNNIGRIYRELNQNLSHSHSSSQIQYKKEPEETEVKEGEAPQREETEEEREKRVKDLRALIGLELVVDYMNHAKPGQPISDDSTDNESSASPTLEVVALQEEV